MENIDFSLILPCFNEFEIIPDSYARIVETLNSTKYHWEIIFVDDGSSDQTPNLLNKLVRDNPQYLLSAIFHKNNQGRGASVISGFEKARGSIVGFIDIDLEIGEWYIPKFISAVEDGFDVSLACRIEDFNPKSFFRWAASKIYSKLSGRVLHLPCQDTESGYKFFKREKIQPLLGLIKYKRWFFDTEIMALCTMNNFEVAEIPVAFVRRYDKKSSVNLLPDTIRYIRNLKSFSSRLKQ